MSPSVRSIPAGYHAVTPVLTTKDVEKAMGFTNARSGQRNARGSLDPR
jgi:hypothetical protein